jgi:hypothetical protein
MTNYTQDLLFSMERLSQNPYSIRLVDPAEDFPFQVADELTTEITGVTLEELKSAGDLYYVDCKLPVASGSIQTRLTMLRQSPRDI